MKKGKAQKQRGTQLKRGTRLASKKSNVKGSISRMSLINKPRASVMTKTNLPGVPSGLTGFEAGDRLWCQDDKGRWNLELFNEYDEATRLVSLTNEDGTEHKLPATKQFLNANTDVVPDMTSLTFINAPFLFHLVLEGQL